MRRLIVLGTLILCAGPWFFESARAQSSFDPAIAEMISHISDSTMLYSIACLQSFGTRYSYASTRPAVAEWIRGRFLGAGFTDVAFDSFQYSGHTMANVVATIHGSSDSEIVVGAHYDSYSQSPWEDAPGADDDASGTSAVLEMARVISTSGYTPASTIRFIAFSAEEQGLVGSKAYAQKAKNAGRNIRAMLNFDQIGNRSVGDQSVAIVWYTGGEALAASATAVTSQYTTLEPVLVKGFSPSTDSYSFYAQGYPAVWWFESQGTPFYHTTGDIVDFIDKEYAAEMARSALALVLTLDKVTGVDYPLAEALPTTVQLHQNYPNPFNPSTTIRYELPWSSDVRLTVYDLLGREVSVLVNERRIAGSQEVKFDAAGLSSGMYFYCLTAGDFVQSRKMVLMK